MLCAYTCIHKYICKYITYVMYLHYICKYMLSMGGDVFQALVSQTVYRLF